MTGSLGGLIVLGFLLLAVVLYLRRSFGVDVQDAATAQSPVATHIIEYADAFGEVTIRAICIQRVYENANGEAYVDAFCLLRQDSRTFRADRILTLQERSSGRMIEDQEAYFDRWLGKKPIAQRPPPTRISSPESSRTPLPEGHQNIMDRARAGLRIMIWLAKADRRLSEPEEQVMLAWIQYRAQGSKASEQGWSREAALVWLRAERVTFADVERGAARMGQAEGARLVEMLEDLMLADGEKCRLETGRLKKIIALLPER